MLLHLDVQIAVATDTHDLPDEDALKQWLAACHDGQGDVTIRFVTDDEALDLNQNYRQADYTPNVLTFAYAPPPALHADIVLCPNIVEQEAQQQNKNTWQHYAHLVVHGMLHACGYRHDAPHPQQQMEARECAILAKFGLANPYELP